MPISRSTLATSLGVAPRDGSSARSSRRLEVSSKRRTRSADRQLWRSSGVSSSCVMTDSSDLLAGLNARLPRHAAVLDSLRKIVEVNDQLRWLELGCSLGAGGGDEASDLDVGIGYAGSMTPEHLASFGESVAAEVGPAIAMLAHRMDGWPIETCRLAVEYTIGVQLDLVFLPSEWRKGRPDRTIAVVDKDGRLETDWIPPSRRPPEPGLAREWMFLGWWAISNSAKYLKRGSLFEAVEALAEARNMHSSCSPQVAKCHSLVLGL